MTKHFSHSFWLTLISGVGITTLTVLACGGGDWDGTEGSMFTPEIINQPKYAPFFRTLATPFYDGYDDQGADFFKEENSKDWSAYLGISRETAGYWLYEASIRQIDSMIFDIKKKPSYLTEKSRAHRLNNVQSESKAISFLYYIGFAKRNEDFAVKEISYWGEAPKKTEPVSITKQIAGGMGFLAKAPDAFMKERYAFQLERLYFFNKEYDKVIATYTEHEPLFKSENNIRWRAMSYYAGAFWRQKKYAQANYLFSKIYDGFEPLRKTAYLSFHPQQQADWSQCLAMAKTTREKEVLWQMFGLYADHVTAIREILKLNPKSELAEVLLMRAVNMEEEKFSGILESDAASQKEMLAKTDKNLLAYINAMSAGGEAANPVIWHLSGAYLNYIHKDFATADKQLKLAEKYVNNGPLIKEQYHLISLLGKVMRVGDLNPRVENDLVPDLGVLFAKDGDAKFRSLTADRWIRSTLARLAQKKGEYEKAEVILNGIDASRFRKTDPLKSMIAYYNSENKTAFEKIFIEASELKKNDYVELLAIRYAQRDQLEEALKTFQSIPGHNTVLLGNPFTIHIKDCHDCDHEAKQKIKYTSSSFIEKMIEMKSIAASRPAEAAQNYFLVANGFYNMSYYGNARVFYVSNAKRNDVLDATAAEMMCDQALKYYLLAKSATTDRELQAKCTFMAAKCEQNKFFNYRPENYNGDFKSGIYFAMLRTQFADTKYHAEVLRECSYYRTYSRR